MTKDDIFDKYQQLIGIIQDVYYSIDNIVPKNDDVKKFRMNLYGELQNISNDIKKQLEDVMENTSWDKLTIAFLGMTGAGKSTIIETFRILFDKDKNRAEDGLIVGDGAMDFTKEYSEYELTIAGKPFVLIDAPGTEGREKEYKDKICKALGKAHCIFYVLTNIPDNSLVQKIKEYLRDGVTVYTIYNKKNDPDDYRKPDGRVALTNNRDEEKIDGFRSKFTSIIGDRYRENISVQAQLALFSQATFPSERKTFQNNQQKLIEYFGDSESLFTFSEFQSLVNLIENKSQTFLDEIMEANQRKLITKAADIKNRLNGFLENNEKELSKMEENLNHLISNTSSHITDTRTSIRNKSNKSINDFYTILRTEFLKILQNDDSKKEKKEKLKIEFGYRKRVFIEQIQYIVRYELASLKERVHKECGEVNNEYITIATPHFDSKEFMDISIDIDNPVDELGFGLDDVGDIASWVAIGVGLGVRFGPLGAGIGAGVGFVVGGVTKLIGGNKRKKQKAIQELNKAWEKSEREVIDIVGREMNRISSSLVFKNSEFELKVEDERKKIQNMKGLLEQVQKNLDNYIEKINIG